MKKEEGEGGGLKEKWGGDDLNKKWKGGGELNKRENEWEGGLLQRVSELFYLLQSQYSDWSWYLWRAVETE